MVVISQLVTDRHRPFCCEIPFTGHLTLWEHVPPDRSNELQKNFALEDDCNSEISYM
ncbi:uncharacterized, partial [Tachysurus ichikawai]